MPSSPSSPSVPEAVKTPAVVASPQLVATAEPSAATAAPAAALADDATAAAKKKKKKKKKRKSKADGAAGTTQSARDCYTVGCKDSESNCIAARSCRVYVQMSAQSCPTMMMAMMTRRMVTDDAHVS